MDYFEVMKKRQSIRLFQNRPVEDEKIHRIIEAVNLAPSAGDLQAYEIVIVRDPRRKKALAQAAWGQNFIAQAPVCLVFLTYPERSSRKYGQRGTERYSLQDATIAVTIAHLTATALGLGSTWVGAFDDDAVANAIEASKEKGPVAILPLGYPAESPQLTPRRSIGEIVCSEISGVPYPFSFTDRSFERPLWKPAA